MYLIKDSKKRAKYALILRIVGLLVATTAVTLQLVTNAIIGKGFMANHVLAYNTIQTNIMCLLMFLALVVKTLVVYFKEKELKTVEINESLHLAVTYFIFLVMIGYWPILAPMVGLGSTSLEIANTLFLHLFTPLCMILDSLLFLDHGKIKKKDAFKWTIYPVLYLVSIIVIAHTSDVPYYKFPFNGELVPLHYPYPIFDPQIVGTIGFVVMAIVQVFSNLLYSYLFILLDNKIAKTINKRLTH